MLGASMASIQYGEADPACDCHGPVGISPPKNFQQAVCRAARQKYSGKFQNLAQKNHLVFVVDRNEVIYALEPSIFPNKGTAYFAGSHFLA